MTRVAFMGSKRIGLFLFTCMLEGISEGHVVVGVLAPNDLSDERSELTRFRSVAADWDITLAVASTVRESSDLLTAWRPDVIIVSGWYMLTPLEKFPDAKFYGFHFAPLPRYRGNAPLVWQILRDETEIGVSFFELGSGIDDGDIVAQEMIPLGTDMTISEVLQQVEEWTLGKLRRHLSAILDGTVITRRQDYSQATYCGLRQPEDGHVHWNWSARCVLDFVRAQTRPYGGAFTFLPDGLLVRMWRTAVDPRSYVGVPGP